MAPLLEVASLTLRFPGIVALNDVSFVAPRGAITALIGPAGAGKTSLFHCIAGAQAPSGGEIRFEGSSIQGRLAHQNARAGVARTFQTPALFDRLTVYENLLAGAYLRGSTGILRSALLTARARQERREAETVARDILAFVGMGNSAEARPRQLSYAQRKRVEFARALIGSPRLVLLDEPLVGLNAADRAAMTQLILRVREELGIAFLIAERAIPFVMGNADRIVVLDGGRVVAQGSPREIHADPAAIAASG